MSRKGEEEGLLSLYSIEKPPYGRRHGNEENLLCRPDIKKKKREGAAAVE